jgi:hypothetical protein
MPGWPFALLLAVALPAAILFFDTSWIATKAPVLTPLAALLAAYIAWSAIWWNRRMARLKATLDLIEASESKEYYQARYRAYREYRRADAATRDAIADPTRTDHDELRAHCQDFLNHYELVAIACDRGLIDETFYRDWMGPTFVRDWNEATALVHRARRPDGPGDAGNPGAYVNFERLALRWGGKPWP